MLSPCHVGMLVAKGVTFCSTRCFGYEHGIEVLTAIELPTIITIFISAPLESEGDL